MGSLISEPNEPCLFDQDNKYLVSTEDTATIKLHFSESFHYGLWLDCCYEAAKCCIKNVANFLGNKTTTTTITAATENANDLRPSEPFCPATWDGLACWPESRSNQIIEGECPDHMYYLDQKPNCNGRARKQCLANGTWMRRNDAEWTDFSKCDGLEVSSSSASSSFNERMRRVKIINNNNNNNRAIILLWTRTLAFLRSLGAISTVN